MNTDFNPDRLRLSSSSTSTAVRPAARLPHHQRGSKFLKGPIPLVWLTAAATQPGRALHVALAIWFLAGIKRAPTIALPTSLLSAFGVDRYAGYRGLNALERVRLVSVIRHPGRLPIVTILDTPAD